MNQQSAMIEQLAAAIAVHTAPVIPINYDLWDSKHVAAYLKMSVHSFQTRYAPMSDFPRAIRLPSISGRQGNPRWKALDVIRWAEKHIDKN